MTGVLLADTSCHCTNRAIPETPAGNTDSAIDCTILDPRVPSKRHRALPSFSPVTTVSASFSLLFSSLLFSSLLFSSLLFSSFLPFFLFPSSFFLASQKISRALACFVSFTSCNCGVLERCRNTRSESPGTPHRYAHEPGSLVIPNDLLPDRIPPDRSAGPDCDLAQVADEV
jgi:hypothetical protein